MVSPPSLAPSRVSITRRLVSLPSLPSLSPLECKTAPPGELLLGCLAGPSGLLLIGAGGWYL